MAENHNHDIEAALNLWCETGAVYELRVKQERGMAVGYFNDLDRLAEVARHYSDAGAGAVYLTLNPVRPELLDRAPNRMGAKNATGADGVARRRLVLVDFDAERPDKARTNSTADEHDAAEARARACRDWLACDHGFPAPLLCDSGNGWHLLYRVDLDNDDASTRLVVAFLSALGSRFTDAAVEVDQSVHDPSRICKVPGTWVRKGPDTPDRPHRRARLVEAPDRLAVVPREALERVAGTGPINFISTNQIKNDGATRPAPPGDPAPGDAAASVAWVDGFLARHGVEVKATKVGGRWRKRWNLATCPFCGEADRSAVITVNPAGKVGFRCWHSRCSAPRKTWTDFRQHHEPGWTPDRKPKSKAARLLAAVCSACDLFCSPDGLAYATMTRNGRRETHRVDAAAKGSAFRHWVYAVGEAAGLAGLAKVVPDVVAHCEARAVNGGDRRAVYRRRARVGGVVWVDLCNDAGEVVRVDADGWTITTDCPVPFLRGPNMAPLPGPESGGDLDELRPFVNVGDDDWPLLRGFIMDCWKGGGPYLTALVNGEQGSAKSTLARKVRELVDPVHEAPVRLLPAKPEDAFVAATTNAILCYDNVSAVPQWLSDVFASLNTGSGYATRGMYQQTDEKVWGATTPVLLNGIPDFAEASDLLDRCVRITCQPIPDDRRMTEVELAGRFAAVAGRVFGAVMAAVSSGLRHAGTGAGALGRMADAEAWIAACETGMTGGRFRDAYRRCRDDLNLLALEASPVASALLAWLDTRREHDWTGTATELYEELVEVIPDRSAFPRLAHKLTAELRRAAPALRRVGITVQTRKSNGRKLVEVARDPAPPPAPGTLLSGADGPTLRELTDGRLPWDHREYEVEQRPDGSATVRFRVRSPADLDRLDANTRTQLATTRDGRQSFMYRPPAIRRVG